MTSQEMARLHAACFSSPRPWTAAEFDALAQEPHTITLTEPGGLLVGRVVAGEAEVLTLAVDPGARRMGIGRGLLARFLVQATARGAERAFLEVRADNAAAIALYLGAGFGQAGLRRGYYGGVDALVLLRLMPTGTPEI